MRWLLEDSQLSKTVTNRKFWNYFFHKKYFYSGSFWVKSTKSTMLMLQKWHAPKNESQLTSWTRSLVDKQLPPKTSLKIAVCMVVVSKPAMSSAKPAMSIFRNQNSGSFKISYVHIESFGVLKCCQISVPWCILHIGTHTPQNINVFHRFSFRKSCNKGPNFNLNYLSSMFLDIAGFETTTTIYRRKHN